MKLKIKVTKEILEKSKMCGIGGWKHPDALHKLPTQNCAISLACQEIFPQCDVSDRIDNTGRLVRGIDVSGWDIPLPEIATDFIKKFDRLSPEDRVKMQPIEFEVEVGEDVLACINIEEVKEALKTSKTLELID